MPSDHAVPQSKEVCQFADLKTVSGSEHNRVAPAFQFVNNWLEEGNVRGVLQVDPYFFWGAALHDHGTTAPFISSFAADAGAGRLRSGASKSWVIKLGIPIPLGAGPRARNGFAAASILPRSGRRPSHPTW